MTQDDQETPLERINLSPEGDTAEAAIIWLHGLGADGDDFAPLFQDTGGRLARVRVLLPHAPQRPVTLNGGMRMRAWHDLESLDFNQTPDMEGIRHSARAVGALVEELEAEGIASHRIVLGGFSQGAAIALWTGLGLPRPLAGIAALSGYLPPDPTMSEAQRSTPIFLGHGRHDEVVPFQIGEAVRDRLEALGCRTPVWHPYPIDHGVGMDEAEDLLDWLVEALKEGA